MAVPKILILYQNNSQYIEIDNLADGITAQSYNSATVQANLIDTNNLLGAGAGASVTGFPINLSYVAASTGVYRGLAPVGFGPPVGSYTMVITATYAGITLTITIPTLVMVRTS